MPRSSTPVPYAVLAAMSESELLRLVEDVQRRLAFFDRQRQAGYARAAGRQKPGQFQPESSRKVAGTQPPKTNGVVHSNLALAESEPESSRNLAGTPFPPGPPLTPEVPCRSLRSLGVGVGVGAPVNHDAQTEQGLVLFQEQVFIASRGRARGVALRALLEPNGVLPEGELTADEVFDQVFWPAYPRKVAKIAAYKAWHALHLRDDDERTMAAIMAGLRRDVKNEWFGREPDKIPHASTWLNQHRWEG